MRSLLIVIWVILLCSGWVGAHWSQSFSPQLGVSVGPRDYIHLRTGLTWKCCSPNSSIYGNQTGPGLQFELTPRRLSLQPGFSFQWRYRKQGLWVVRPYYFYGQRYSGAQDNGGGIQAGTPWGGFGLEFGSDYSAMLISWDF